MTKSPRPRPQRLLRLAVVLALSASVLYAVITTIHWPIVGDSPLLHYTTFLLDNGKQPYTQIVEMDLPGTYAIEWTARHILGPGPLAWRFADFLLILLCWLSMIAITLTPQETPAGAGTPPELVEGSSSLEIGAPTNPIPDWLPGFFAGALFALIHFRDGPTHTGQRDLMMTAMLLPATALLFRALNANIFAGTSSSRPESASFADGVERPLYSSPYPLPPIPFLLTGLFLGAAATIKPSALFFAIAFTAIALFHLHRTHRRILIPFFLLFDGFILPLLITALWLHHHHALRAFFSTMSGLAAYHASLGRPKLAALIVGSFPNVALAVAIPAIPLFVTQKPWRNWQGQLLIAATVLGCASYILQGKGFPYHRYPTEAFLFLLIATLAFYPLQHSVISTEGALLRRSGETPVFSARTQAKTLTTYAALATIALGAFFLAPVSAQIAGHFDWRDQEFNRQLATDLTTISHNNPASLQNQIQCFDNTAGCINTLYNLQLVQATGFLYDCYTFQPKPSPYQSQYRTDFLTAVQRANPRILVVSDQDCFTMNRTFARLNRWPAFIDYVAQNYTLAKQYTPPHTIGWWRHPSPPFSYRIYLRKPE